MISEIFKAIFITSIAGSALAGVISLLRPITKKIFGYSWHYYIWLSVLFVMLVPVRFNIKPASMPDITAQTAQTERITVTEQPQTAENIVRTDAVHKPQLLQRASLVWDRIIYNRINILAYLWLGGAIFLILLNIVRYIKLKNTIRKNGKIAQCPEIGEYTGKKINVRVWGNVASPFMTGVFRPMLILPEAELSGEQLHNILRHEMTHFKRHDILYKWFAELTSCIHWFNPVSWYVSKQIAAECEISCDMAVTENMSDGEKMSYINTILFLLPTGKSAGSPLTTQMASSKKILKRRFAMIKNRKTMGRLMSALSGVMAFVMFSATVFASGNAASAVLGNVIGGADAATGIYVGDEYTVDILNGSEKIELTNKPFVANGTVYVPLREIIEKSVSKDSGVAYIKWNDGTIEITIAYYQGESGMYRLNIGSNQLGLKHISFEERDKKFDEIKNNVRVSLGLKQAPVLKQATTYVPLRDANYMLYGFTSRRDENNTLREMTCNVYDKNGMSIYLLDPASPIIVTSQYDNTTSEYTIDQFFYFFAGSDFENMKRYCTQSCIDRYFRIFGDESMSSVNNVYDMTAAVIITMENSKEYAANSQITYVTVNCVRPVYSSIYDPDGIRKFGVITVRQPDGGYLIDGFEQAE